MKLLILASVVAVSLAQLAQTKEALVHTMDLPHGAATFDIAIQHDASIDQENAAAEAAIESQLQGAEKQAAQEFINGLKSGKLLSEVGEGLQKFNFSAEQTEALMTKLTDITDKVSHSEDAVVHHHARPYPVHFSN